MALTTEARDAIRAAVALAPPIPEPALDRLSALFDTLPRVVPSSRVGTDDRPVHPRQQVVA